MPSDRPYKVLSPGRVQPARSHHQGPQAPTFPSPRFVDQALSSGLASPVRPDGIDRRIDRVRCRAAAVEDVVGTVLNQGRTGAPTGFGKLADGPAVEAR